MNRKSTVRSLQLFPEDYKKDLIPRT